MLFAFTILLQDLPAEVGKNCKKSSETTTDCTDIADVILKQKERGERRLDLVPTPTFLEMLAPRETGFGFLPTEPRITPIATTMDIPLDSRQNLPGEIACQRNNCPGKAEQVFTRQTIARP